MSPIRSGWTDQGCCELRHLALRFSNSVFKSGHYRKILRVASLRSFHYIIVRIGKSLCQNQTLLKNLRSFKKLNPARIGGARAAGQNRSRFATGRTRAPASPRKRWTLPRPKPLPGAAASTRRTLRSATALTLDCDRRLAARDEQSCQAPFFRKS